MPILDNAVLLGKESTYGTVVPLTRAYEAKADTWKRTQDFLESKGMRGGAHTQRSDRSRQINMGGEGTIEMDILSTGQGLILQAMFGSVSGPTLVSGTAYKSIHATTPADPNDAWTVQVLRDMNGTQQQFTHKGCVITGWTIKQDVGGLLMADMKFDFQDVDTSTSAGTPTYVALGAPFDWTQCAATWNGVAIDLKDFSLDADLGLDTDRRYLRGSALKKQPIRKSVPVFNGSMSCDFDALTHYNAFVAGTVAPLIVTWTGAAIGVNFEVFKLTMPSVQFTGSSPEAGLEQITKQDLPFKVLHGSAAAITCEYTSTDVAL